MECPKCGHTRQPEHIRCSGCDLVFAKYETYLERKAELEAQRTEAGGVPSERLRAIVDGLLEPGDVTARYWWPYAVLWAVFVIWGWSYMLESLYDLGWDPGFLHAINLPFHEAGHVIFGVFGDFIGSLGGTLGQLLIPIVCAVALLRGNHDTFGASLCLWWFGQNFLDIAPYMADARAGEIPLLGGNRGNSSPYGFHDWEFILGETGLLAWDRVLATITLNGGRLIMLTAMLWGAWLLWRARTRA
ncbi:hypothetical protein [Halofilum ochraceum]|uniref:hypothetical protein n=1 Tax=Halofilum ochraceum TaxID=1611323 RepID=UPI0008DAE59C|nr:hypothetical protein [Halofilum ochraceum]